MTIAGDFNIFKLLIVICSVSLVPVVLYTYHSPQVHWLVKQVANSNDRIIRNSMDRTSDRSTCSCSTSDNVNKTSDRLDRTTDSIFRTSDNEDRTSDSVGRTTDSINRTSERVNRTSDSVNRISDNVNRTSDIIIRNSDMQRNSVSVNRTSDSVDGISDSIASAGEISGEMIKVSAFFWRCRGGYWKWLPDHLFESCPKRRCIMIDNMNESDVVLFTIHAMKIVSNCNLALPSRTNPQQKWIMSNRESTSRIWINSTYLDLFNATASYLSSSEVVRKFGEVKLRNMRVSRSYHDDNWSSKKNVAWMISHCGNRYGGRWAYAGELAKHIDVSVYGKCGNFSCPKDQETSCMDSLNKSYRFYLAFENSLCQEYVTEKLYRTLNSDMIPIVYGLYDYKGMLPEKSVIDVRDFDSPKHLADYLKVLAQNKTLFDSYFKWKEYYEVFDYDYDTYMTGMACNLCEYLQSTKHHPPRTVDLREAHNRNQCMSTLDFLPTVGISKETFQQYYKILRL